METKNKSLDELNNNRIVENRKRVAHAIKLLNNVHFKTKLKDDDIRDIAHAVNLLETAVQEIGWACDHFDWNTEIGMQIDDACIELGIALADLTYDTDEHDDIDIVYRVKDTLAILAKALATLTNWFEDFNAEEI